MPDPWWLTALLAFVLFADAAMSVRPPTFIRDCLTGVGFPAEWWWTLVLIKLLAVVGLVVGIAIPGVAFAANAGVVAYFLAAGYAHIRKRFLGSAFWLNCLGMLAFSLVVLLTSYLV